MPLWTIQPSIFTGATLSPLISSIIQWTCSLCLPDFIMLIKKVGPGEHYTL